jgi:hypothetical protein
MFPALELLVRRCHDEVQERADLRRRHVARRVEYIKREALVVPAREELDEGPGAYEIAVAEIHELGDAVTCEANAERRRDVVDDEPTVDGDRAQALLAAMELPLERASRHGVHEH